MVIKKREIRSEEDRISQLPDHLISHILSHLSTKDATRTSVLSTRWTSLWLWVSRLELSSLEFPDFHAFISFGDKFFASSRVSCIDKLQLSIIKENDNGVDDASYLTSWIDAAIKRKIQHLYVRWYRELQSHKKPLRLYNCETLVHLEFFKVTLDHAEFSSFPCLKTMHLEDNLYPNEAAFEKLVSSCPVLEELYIKVSLVEVDEIVFRVHSQSLKRLTFIRCCCCKYSDNVSGVVIDAPLLCFLCIDDDISKSFIVNNLESNAKLDISISFGLWDFNQERNLLKISNIRKFLPGISRVMDLTICGETINVICGQLVLEQLPQFSYMSHLCISLRGATLKCLAKFLKSCPNLKSLILEQFGYGDGPEEMNQISVSYVPECLLSSLEFVDFKEPIVGHAVQMNTVIYLLENSAVLKKLTLRLHQFTIDGILKTLFKTPRGSTKCEVVIL